MIEKNKILITKMKEIIENEQKEKEKLKLVDFTATFYWLNVCGKYRDYHLEKEIEKIGKNRLKQNIVNQYKKNRVLHIITETYLTGGHTRLLNNWIKFDTDKIPDVVIINPQKSKLGNWLKENIKQKKGTIYFLKKQKILLKAQELLGIIENYSEIILHIHPNDLITCLALSCLNNNQKVYFVNHADHVFSLGYNYSNCVLELSCDGQKMGNIKRKIEFSEVLPIPIEKIISEEKIIVSMAAEYKYEPTSKYNFQLFLDELLEVNKNIIFNLIGPSEKNKMWKPLKEKYGNRINLLGVLKKEEVDKKLKEANLYVDSFPLSSYTCILEAINLNIPVISLKTELSDLDSLKEIKVKNISELILKINNILNNENENENEDLKKLIAQDHYENGWLNRLREIRFKDYRNKNILKEDVDYYFEDYEKLFLSASKDRVSKFSYRRFFNLKIKNQIKIMIIYLKIFYSCKN